MPIIIFDWIFYATGALLVILFLSQAIYIFREYERGVMFTLGRFTRVCGPGFVIMIPVVQQVVRTDLRTFVDDVPTQDVISRDNHHRSRTRNPERQGLYGRGQPVGADDAALGAGQARAR
jgi:regulator of protease activity HflC (stomatin/prohibitin superfamily)